MAHPCGVSEVSAWADHRQSMNPIPTKASAGFSLIELSLVVVLLSIFTFLAVQSLDNLLPRHRMEASARDIAATIRTARDQAILTSRKTGLFFDMEKKQFWILLPPEDGSEPLVDPTKERFGSNTLSTHQLAKGVSFSGIQPVGGDLQESGQMSVEVSPFGAFSDLIIYLANEEEKELTLLINGMTGQPEFFNGHINYEDLVAKYEPK